MKYLVITLLFTTTYAHHNGQDHLISVSRLNEIANHVNNNPDSTWQAQQFDPSMDDDHVNFLMRTGVLEGEPAGHTSDADERANNCEDNGLPAEFDARKRWPECASVIHHIYDQGNCGSCWAVSTVAAFSDRVCIASKGKIRSIFSGQQMLSCCHRCTGRSRDGKYNGCNGGWPMGAWSYIKRNGLATGGDYDSNDGCQPYLHQHCEHHINGTYPTCSTLPQEKAAKCRLHCYNKSYYKSFKKDKIKAKRFYTVAPCAAMNEIYRNGSIVAEIAVYEDFFTYKNGVYQHITGEKKGKHAVRVIGWGQENGIPYWIVANSWNSHWGDNGIIKIKRENNEIWIEDAFSTVEPAV